MYLQASHILNLPVASLDPQEKIGNVFDIIVDPKELKSVGFLVIKRSLFVSQKLLLSQSDVLDIDKHGIVTRNEENLVEPNEVIRIKNILKNKVKILNQRACTKSGKNLGKISDLVFEKETGFVSKFYIHGWLEDKIIPREKLIKITSKKLIFEDDVIEITQSVQPEEAAA